MSLAIKVFVSSDQAAGFGVSSTIIYGDKQAILVDAQFTLSNAHRLVAELMELGRDLTMVFITHLHPDHFLGLEVIKAAYPAARVVAYGKAADDVNDAYDFKIDYWGNAVLNENGANIKYPVEKLDSDILLLEGEKINILGLMCGDCITIAPLWIPSLRTLIASDLVFADAHVWIADMRTPALIEEWLRSLDTLEDLQPVAVVAGHSPQNPTLSPSAIDFTRQYIRTFMKQFHKAASAEQLQQEMERIYPNLPVKICLEYSARILKDKYVWPGDWPLTLRNTPSTW
ncbi:MBL fold metallo-hydrolase [Martelella alba]|uniref:MBL fold metallo-hydrolase n=1 Tax=Martelella alba TaxID=2590451 RepID=A0ABY2SJC3_9HYPH|nr:MBL fold metallo-hydrolase [Martelella alba]TKI04107.1 MBL fold metallo-hydrolase [Martelella alba]